MPGCVHQEVEDGRCLACGACVHEVVLNGVCYFCGAADIEVTVKPSEPPLVAADRLVRGRDPDSDK